MKDATKARIAANKRLINKHENDIWELERQNMELTKMMEDC